MQKPRPSATPQTKENPKNTLRIVIKVTLPDQSVLVSSFPDLRSFLEIPNDYSVGASSQNGPTTHTPPALLPFKVCSPQEVSTPPCRQGRICENVLLLWGTTTKKRSASAQDNNSLPASDWQRTARSEASSANLGAWQPCSYIS